MYEEARHFWACISYLVDSSLGSIGRTIYQNKDIADINRKIPQRSPKRERLKRQVVHQLHITTSQESHREQREEIVAEGIMSGVDQAGISCGTA